MRIVSPGPIGRVANDLLDRTRSATHLSDGRDVSVGDAIQRIDERSVQVEDQTLELHGRRVCALGRLPAHLATAASSRMKPWDGVRSRGAS